MLDIHTVGAGGGSIARIDEGGALLVGPESAGSTPGPACYGRGGTRPTVTDADVLLGFIEPDSFLGGEMRLDKTRAEAAIARDIAAPLGMDPFEAALAVFDIVNANMANAIHFVTTKRGHDPRDFALLAAGGAGAIHAGRQAEDLGDRDRRRADGGSGLLRARRRHGASQGRRGADALCAAGAARSRWGQRRVPGDGGGRAGTPGRPVGHPELRDAAQHGHALLGRGARGHRTGALPHPPHHRAQYRSHLVRLPRAARAPLRPHGPRAAGRAAHPASGTRRPARTSPASTRSPSRTRTPATPARASAPSASRPGRRRCRSTTGRRCGRGTS